MAVQDEVPKSRITLRYRTEIDGTPADIQLPLRLLMMGDFSLGTSKDRLGREKPRPAPPTLPGSTSNPSTPLRTNSGVPLTRVEITGLPNTMPSSNTRGISPLPGEHQPASHPVSHSCLYLRPQKSLGPSPL